MAGTLAEQQGDGRKQKHVCVDMDEIALEEEKETNKCIAFWLNKSLI